MEREPTQQDIDMLNKLFAMSPDELLQKIAICKAKHPDKPKMLDALVSAFKCVCELKLAEIIGKTT